MEYVLKYVLLEAIQTADWGGVSHAAKTVRSAKTARQLAYYVVAA